MWKLKNKKNHDNPSLFKKKKKTLLWDDLITLLILNFKLNKNIFFLYFEFDDLIIHFVLNFNLNENIVFFYFCIKKISFGKKMIWLYSQF